MPNLSRSLVAAEALPVLFYGLLSAALCAWVRGPVFGLLVLSCGVLFTGVIAVIAARRARTITADLSDLTAQLAAGELIDVRSLRPRTREGQGIASALDELITKVRDAAHSEDAVRREIETAQALRVNFVASMGHDLRAPLNNMLGFADLLIMDEADPHAERQRASVETIRQRTLDLLTLIDEILDWARVEAGRLKLDPRPVPLAELVAGALSLAEHRAAGRPLEVNHVPSPDLPRVQVDRARVEQAIVAVMGDAIRNGQGAPVTVEVDLSEAGHALVVVRDPKLLVREEDQARFFEPFRPSYAPSGKRIAGLGLGVACARAILRAHGGDVSFTSSVGEGTVFRLRMPLADAGEERGRQATP